MTVLPDRFVKRRLDAPPGFFEVEAAGGDLWSGNVFWCADGVYLIDPAAHGGHRETDLAMLGLFGIPQLERVLRGYNEVRPLADGWRDRIGLHRLHPLLTHVVMFGTAYVAQALAMARKY